MITLSSDVRPPYWQSNSPLCRSALETRFNLNYKSKMANQMMAVAEAAPLACHGH